MKIKLSQLLAIAVIVIIVAGIGLYSRGNITSATIVDDSRVELAKALTDNGAVMYGAFWCSHCKNQKAAFGKEAFKEINYVECDERGDNAQPAACQVAGITGYPTWIINGEKYSGELSLERLAQLIGFEAEL